MSDEFNFGDFNIPFFGSSLPPEAGEYLLRGIVMSSKGLRTMFEEHVRNGFTDEQALAIVMSFQENLIKMIGQVVSEVSKTYNDQKSSDD